MKTEHIVALGVVGYALLNKAENVVGQATSSLPSIDISGASQSFKQVMQSIQLSVPQFTAYTNSSGNTYVGYTPAVSGPLAASNNPLPDSWKCWLV